MADAELGVMLEPKNDIEDEVDDVTVGVGGESKDLSPAQQQQQESVVAGGVSKGLAAAGVLVGILSQLKSVTGIINAVFGTISRALVPTVEVLAEILRPLVSAVNDFISNPGQTIQNVTQGTVDRVTQRNEIQRTLIEQGEARRGPFGTTVAEGSPGEAIFEVLDLFPESADQSGEATKQRFKENLDETQRDKTGNFR